MGVGSGSSEYLRPGVGGNGFWALAVQARWSGFVLLLIVLFQLDDQIIRDAVVLDH